MGQGEASAQSVNLVFYPFAYALYAEECANYCWYCLRKPENALKRCTGCRAAVFCGKECSTLGWKDHQAECKGMQKHAYIPDIEIRLLARIVARYKAIYSGKDKQIADFYLGRESKRSILELCAHTEEMRKDVQAWKRFEVIFNEVQTFYEPKFLMSKETVFELHARDFINRHAISDAAYLKEIGKGLYLDMCRYDHSCRPNTIYTCDGFVATLRALNGNVDITDTATTFYSYIDLLNSHQQRAKMLKDTWYFDCRCERCVDPDDHLISAVLCANCKDKKPQRPLQIFGTSEFKDPNTQRITCPDCSQELPQNYVVDCIGAMRNIQQMLDKNELDQMSPSNRRAFIWELLKKNEQRLPSCNVYLCRILQALIPLVPATDNVTLLHLHRKAFECLTQCYPDNHPALSFHLRHMAVFAANLSLWDEAEAHAQKANASCRYVLGDDHPMTKETSELLEETKKARREDEAAKKGQQSVVEDKPPIGPSTQPSEDGDQELKVPKQATKPVPSAAQPSEDGNRELKVPKQAAVLEGGKSSPTRYTYEDDLDGVAGFDEEGTDLSSSATIAARLSQLCAPSVEEALKRADEAADEVPDYSPEPEADFADLPPLME